MSDREFNEGVMNDREWETWADAYLKETRPMPSVMKRASNDRKRAIVAMTVADLVGAALAVAAIVDVSHAHSITRLASPLLLLVLALAVVVSMHVAMWGAFAHAGRAPMQLLAELERRHAARRRLVRFMPWLAGLGVAAAIGTDAATMFAAGSFNGASALGTLATCGLTVGLVWFIGGRVGRVIDRELRETVEARRLLMDEDPQ